MKYGLMNNGLKCSRFLPYSRIDSKNSFLSMKDIGQIQRLCEKEKERSVEREEKPPSGTLFFVLLLLVEFSMKENFMISVDDCKRNARPVSFCPRSKISSGTVRRPT